jgi:hypothetical protein
MRRLLAWARANRGAAVAIAAGGIVVFALGIYWFAPQNLFLDERVDEALPGAIATPAGEGAGTTGATGPSGSEPPAAEESTVLARGDFRSLEHATSGEAQVIELADGTRYLRLEGLETSNGPDLRVYLTDQPLSDDWGIWDDGRFIDLGGLRGNVGSSNYEIPEDVDVGEYRTAVIWCRRFTVGFGVAPIVQA